MIITEETPNNPSPEGKEFIKTIKEKFGKRYDSAFQGFNKSIIISPTSSEGIFVPSVEISEEGFGKLNELTTLPKAAKVAIVNKYVPGTKNVYRIHIPLDQCQLVLKNDNLFNYLFDNIVKTVMMNYEKKYGKFTDSRFGEYFCNYDILWFNDEYVELRLTGHYIA